MRVRIQIRIELSDDELVVTEDYPFDSATARRKLPQMLKDAHGRALSYVQLVLSDE